METRACKMASGRANAKVSLARLVQRPSAGWVCVPIGLTLAVLCVALFAGPAYSQTLDEAVKAQLDYNIMDGLVCSQLRNGDLAYPSYLTGELLSICTRGGPSGGNPSSFSTGGGARTPVPLPSIVQQQVREARAEKRTDRKVTGASADEGVERHGPLAFFVSAGYEALDRNVTTFEDGYDSDIRRVTAGADFRAGERWLLGLAFDGSRADGNFKGGGGFEVVSYGAVGFGAFLPTERAFFQFYGGYASNSYDRDRNGTFVQLNSDKTLNFQSNPGSQNADYDAARYSAGALVGYDYPIGSVTIRPHAGVDWQRTDFGSYSETGSTGLELTFHDDHETLLQSTLGVRASVALRAGSWVLVPQASFNWISEHENKQREVTVSFVEDLRQKRFTYLTAIPDEDWFKVTAGLSAVLGSRLQAFANYSTLVGNSHFDSHAGTIGLRVAF